MKKIVLACAGGLSTSILLSKMQKEAVKENLKIEIIAIAEDKLKSVINSADCVLLGPQVGYMLEDLRSKYKSLNIPIDVIDIVDYGMMDGKKVLNIALQLMN